MSTSQPSSALAKIKLYTNHGCGWCHRVHITLKELGLEYEEVKVDLDQARPAWFLALNPRGLVPVFQYTPGPHASTLTLTESGLIVSFLTELYPSHLIPPPPVPAALTPTPTGDAVASTHLRYRMSFIIDAFFTKVNPFMFKLVGADAGEAQDKMVDDMIGLLEKEIEPLLPEPGAEKGPYFDGSEKLTLVEASTQSPSSTIHLLGLSPLRIFRFHDFANGVIFPTSLADRMLGPTLPRFSHWVKLCMTHPSVTYVWDKEYFLPRIEERLGAAKKKYANMN
ncbi:uncharacterized protein Z518_00031 [Rhinocladiella mackenziei CBS 650.93]|uniref:GST N-terminal domain-containing protein n=1 Tax=Rhinocladiella mackenziei CBS 650.93 TaxID=1442369 RepID=A0A0D2HEF8_9EURO|nr:uncharacterized protein Z518_00031 [Rhinocladiella mackenziei CBS 650.93]KIX08953.1 hypothetical protein Z518_00031 [Rhinocladiella mackenziei CBS 650.93]